MQLGVHMGGGGGNSQGYSYIQSHYWGGGVNSILLNPKGGNVAIGLASAPLPFCVSGSIYIGAYSPSDELQTPLSGGVILGNSNSGYAGGAVARISPILDGAGWYEGGGMVFLTNSGSDVSGNMANQERMRISRHGNVVIGSGSAPLLTTSTDGFLYIPTMAGNPSSTPRSYTHRVPIVVDTTNNRLYYYNSGWQYVSGSGGGSGGSVPASNITAGTYGVGTYVYPATSKLTVNGQYNSVKYALTDGATIAIDWNNGNVQSVTLGGSRTITFANPVTGGRYLLILTQDATGGRTITWPTVKWTGGSAPTLTTTGTKSDLITLVYDGTSYYGMASVNF
jgi:hypothetical protein